jgi:hypothetical protein
MRPAITHKASEFEAVHGPRHFHVGEEHPHIRSLQENLLRRLSIGGLYHLETGILEGISRRKPNEGLIFHKEHDGS